MADERRVTMSLHRVVYKGLSDIREMSVKDLKEAGVHVGADLKWDKTRHGHRPAVYLQDVSDRMLEILRQEGTFTVTEIDEETMQEQGGDPIMVGEALDDTGAIVVDGTTGQRSSAGEPDPNADPVPSGGDGAGTGSATGSTGRGRSTAGDSGSTGSGAGRGKGRST
jgi:hypothetical protein